MQLSPLALLRADDAGRVGIAASGVQWTVAEIGEIHFEQAIVAIARPSSMVFDNV
jgi:hypothetical protein